MFDINTKFKALFLSLLLLSSLLNATRVLAADIWQKAVAELIDAYEKSANNPMPIVYPQLAGRVRRLFLSNETTHIRISRGTKETKALSDLYFRNGELHIVEHKEGWNLTTKGDSIYEWETGKDDGVRIKKNEKDMVHYIVYLTDPALFMTSIYGRYLNNKQAFNVKKDPEQGCTELELKEPEIGIEAIFVTEEPLWFCGVRTRGADGKGEVYEILVSKPEGIKEIPKVIKERSDKIRFKESDETLERHMDYL